MKDVASPIWTRAQITEPRIERMSLEQDERISDVVKRDQPRLRNFIRRRVPDPRDAEDVLQEVFYELVEANRLLMPIEHVTGWLYRVARNRITDLFRKKKPENFSCLRPMPDPTLFMLGACFSTNSNSPLTSCPTNSARSLSAMNWKAEASKRCLRKPESA